MLHHEQSRKKGRQLFHSLPNSRTATGGIDNIFYRQGVTRAAKLAEKRRKTRIRRFTERPGFYLGAGYGYIECREVLRRYWQNKTMAKDRHRIMIRLGFLINTLSNRFDWGNDVRLSLCIAKVRLTTDRMVVRLVHERDAYRPADYYAENRTFQTRAGARRKPLLSFRLAGAPRHDHRNAKAGQRLLFLSCSIRKSRKCAAWRTSATCCAVRFTPVSSVILLGEKWQDKG